MSQILDEAELIRVSGGINAESLIAALRGNGIPVSAHGEALGAIYGLTLDGLGEVSIRVPKEYLEEARLILAAGEQGDLQLKENDSIEDEESSAE